MNLYETLGVKKSAKTDVIRKAYRNKAKKAHPDVGGSEKEFAMLKKAHDILIDPERRRKYDATGDTSEKAPDNTMSNIIQLLAQVMETVVMQIMQRGGDPVHFNIVKNMKEFLENQLEQDMPKKVEELKALRKKAEKLLGRFKTKKGENYLECIIVAKVTALNQQIELIEKQKEPIKMALNILMNASFTADKKEVDRTQGPTYVSFGIGGIYGF